MAIGQHVARALAAKDQMEVERTDMETIVKDQAEPTQASILLQIAGVLADLKGSITSGNQTTQAQALAQAEALQQILIKTRPENVSPPLVGVFNPAGERDHPKPALKCRMFWVGYELRLEQQTPREVELLNQVQPGNYRVMKSDGTLIPFTVTPTQDNTGKLDKLEFSFSVKGDAKHNHQSMTDYLEQILGAAIPSREDLLAQIEALKAQVKAA